MRQNRNIIANTYEKFTPLSNKLTEAYEDTYGLPCDLYFPIRYPKKGASYQAVNLYEPHELPEYPAEPSAKGVYFYIPHLMAKESMNSIADQFDNFALRAEGKDTQPFIETTSAKELPIATKVVVHIGASEKLFFINKKTVVNGASGHMLMRQYLCPLTKDGRNIQREPNRRPE